MEDITSSQISQFIQLLHSQNLQLTQKLNELQTQSDELDLIIKNLSSEFPNQFQRNLVPFGSFAFMKGKAVDNDQVTVFLGDDWFVKVTRKEGVGILERRKARIAERVTLIREEIDQLKVKIKTSEGMLSGNILGKNEDGLDFMEIRETEEESMETLPTPNPPAPTHSNQPSASKIVEIEDDDDDDDDVLSEEETIIPDGAQVVKLKILDRGEPNTSNQPLTEEQIENKRYLDSIFASIGSDAEEDDDYEGDEGDDEEEDNDYDDSSYRVYNPDDDDDDYDYDDDEDEDSDDLEEYYRNLPSWAKMSLNMASPPGSSQKTSKKKKVSFAPDVEEPTITVRKPADIKHRIQQILDKPTPNASELVPNKSTPKSNNPETMKMTVVERDVDDANDEVIDPETVKQNDEDLKEAKEIVDRYKLKMDQFKYEHEFEGGMDRKLIRDQVQLGDDPNTGLNYDWQEQALARAFDKQMQLDTQSDTVLAQPETKPAKKVSKFKQSRQQTN